MNRNRIVVTLLATLAIVAGVLFVSGAGIVDAMGGDDDTPITGAALEEATAAALAHTGGGTVTETEMDDDDGYYEVEVALDDGSQVAVHLDESFNVLGQEADDDGADDQDDDAGEADDDADDAEDQAEGEDTPITADALQQARAAALEYVGEGEVTDSEVGDEEGYYEIEITLDDGSQVDVHLDENFNVLDQQADDASDED